MNILRSIAGLKSDEKVDGMDIGAYRLREKIGSGWLGEVWKAERRDTQDVFAIKLLHASVTIDEGFGDRFFAIGRNLEEFRSRHIVTVHEVGQDSHSGRYYIVMDLVRGPKDGRYGGRPDRRGGAPCTLRDLLQGSEAYGLPEFRVSRWAGQIAKALAYAHAHGMTHRDVKPSNILIDENGNARVTDFSWLKAVGASYLEERRRVGIQPMGNAQAQSDNMHGMSDADVQSAVDALLESVESMSPEQCGDLPGEAISSASDVYAFGVLLYQMLTGRRPKGIAAPIRKIVPGVSRRWDRICANCLQHIVRNRYPSGAELLDVLPRRKLRRWQRYLTRRNVGVGVSLFLLLLVVIVPLMRRGALNREARRIAVEQARADAQAEQARIVELMQQADAALAAGRLEEAGEIIATLATNELAQVVMVGLRGRYDARLGEQQAQQLFAEASELRSQVQVWLVDDLAASESDFADLEVRWREANAARQKRSWGEAVQAYRAVLAIGKSMQDRHVARLDAAQRQIDVADARARALAEGADTHADKIWLVAEQQNEQAVVSFGNGEYVAAATAWGQAARSYEDALAHIATMSAYQDVYGAFQSAIAAAQDLLDAYGGSGWQALQEAVVDLSTNPVSPAEAVRVVTNSMVRLDALIREARSAEQSAAVSNLYNRAVSAAENQKWRVVKAEGDALLRLDPEHREMQQLLADAQFWLSPTEGHNWMSPSTGMQFVWVPELGIWVGQFEVTNAEYRKMEPEHDSMSYEGHDLNSDRQPVVRVNYDDAQNFTEWLSMQDLADFPVLAYRLPTESEWLVMASCGNVQDFPWGDDWPPESGQAGNYSDLSARAVFADWQFIRKYEDGFAVSAPVDQLWANAWGVHGIGGNVWELCLHDALPEQFGAWKGASWSHYRRYELNLWHRGEHPADERNMYSGFRLVLAPR